MKAKFNQSNIKVAIASAIIVGSVSLSTSGYAGTLTVNAIVGEACVVDASTTMNFSGYNAAGIHNLLTGVDLTSSAAVGSLCNSGTTALFNLDQGANGAGTALLPTRKLSTGVADAPMMDYQLYKDDGYVTVFGAGGDGAPIDQGGLTLVANGLSNDVNIYGVLTKGQTVPQGTYTDIVNITITY
jgi:spore coat protein U-like protein